MDTGSEKVMQAEFVQRAAMICCLFCFIRGRDIVVRI